MDLQAILRPLQELSDCALCPRNCHADRLHGRGGYCRSDDSFSIASICIHKGEEPAISGPNGICNIFFTSCNLRCIYCQNHQISNRIADRSNSSMDFDQVCSSIIAILDQGINMVGFVSPSHFIPQMLSIIKGVNASGHHPTWVYNSNGYDKPETLHMLEGIIDIYLPDLKYLDNRLSLTLSDAADYPEYAKKALKEMFRQKGTTLVLNDDGTASSGMIIRHLVLPGQVENTLEVLRFIAGELSPRVHVSLMSQYYPTPGVVSHPFLSRSITADEYTKVIDEMELLGLQKGWVQEFESMNHYRPDFTNEHPFENS